MKLATDARWAQLVESNLPEALTDHAYCEQKAASNAISLIVHFPEKSELVALMARLAQEEMAHFEAVHRKILERGWVLGRERKDDYVNEVLKLVRKNEGRDVYLMDRLLFAAMIEARSCERFRLLSERVADPDLAEFYRELMASEAGHYTTFIKLARRYARESGLDADARWREFIESEARIVARYGVKETMHG
ncbi:MAG: tRNA-(ms[2]io[6]A)-hydroxylase [Bacteroidia bacterium]|nr:tRNA-(ms[2]io[6]A)-hydroxylase [Bacteroidia bacterium]